MHEQYNDCRGEWNFFIIIIYIMQIKDFVKTCNERMVNEKITLWRCLESFNKVIS